jgi:hypothetical protein
VILDGPGGRLLRLPTLRLIIDSDFELVEDGTTRAVADLYVSERGMLRKRSGCAWSCHFGAITATFTHGYDDADDFNAAVLSYIDRASLAPSGGRARVIGPFQYDTESMAAGSAFTVAEKAKLDLYRLERI